MKTLEDVAAVVGTPFYAYEATAFRERIRRFRAAFGETHPLVCYALKANDALALIRIAANEGLGADIVSGGELARVAGDQRGVTDAGHQRGRGPQCGEPAVGPVHGQPRFSPEPASGPCLPRR